MFCGTGTIYSRGGRAEAGGPLRLPENASLAESEGLVLRLGGDGNAYSLLLYTGQSVRRDARVGNSNF